jgi:hypothetical protein
MATKESRQDTRAAVTVEQMWSTAERMFWASNGMCTHQNVGSYALCTTGQKSGTQCLTSASDQVIIKD